ncbi:hypothetical protein Syun_017520 [Stephania yunnanensis]|uniref:GPI transamidase component PIG-T n=1 Tax=Stephania yunnanensis TaxID=152371 RepID=A0AAP0P349_9MAGN
MGIIQPVLIVALVVLGCFNLCYGGEEFSEELLLRPLPDRKVLAHFHFESTTPPTKDYGHHHHLFPKAIYQLVHKFRIRELELSFTQGRWNYERWGGSDPISSSNAKPPGVELWAIFDVPLDQVDATWKNLTHTLSGLFCASINFLDSTTAYSSPAWAFQQSSGSIRYGALPREAVCTENLTPWLKLLPCRDKSGLASILDRPAIYRGFYHSQRLRITSNEFGSEGIEPGIDLEQTLTIVVQPDDQRTSTSYSSGKMLQPDWSIRSIFGRKISGTCVLARSSSVFLELESTLVSELNKVGVDNAASDGEQVYPGVELSVAPDQVIKERKSSSVLFEFSVKKHDYKPLDIGVKWKYPIVWSCVQAPFQANRFLMGSGNERGSIAISLRATNHQRIIVGDEFRDNCEMRVVIFQVVPWYVKIYFHTVQVFLDGRLEHTPAVIEIIQVSPSEDRVSPGVMEIALRLPCSTVSAVITVNFDKGFLHIDEYPPDANQGYDIPSAVVRFPDIQASTYYLGENSSQNSPILSKFQENNPVLSYTEVLLVPLATPDFSMPYNVITITCTVFALYFGSLLNVLRRRVGEEERLLKQKAAGKTALLPLILSKLSSKLRGRSREPSESPSPSPLLSNKLIMKVILLAGLAVAWHFYFG